MLPSMLFWSLSLLLLVSLARSAVPGDEIKRLPGLNKQPEFTQYSGYLKASGTKQLHYWFVESYRNPKEDPVVLWMNGGPGCSSVLGLLTENGPFRIMPDGATVEYNPYSWNMIANVLFLEAPAGVGFSFSADKNYTTNDDEVAMDNLLALQDFFSKFSEYKENEFFVSGESYGGIYVPTLSALVVDHQDINFKGFLVGNGISDWNMNSNSVVYFAYYHGLIGERVWGDLVKYCCDGNSTMCNFFKTPMSGQCQKATGETNEIIYGSGLNEYNLYAECVPANKPGSVHNNKIVTNNFGWQFSNLYQRREREMLKRMDTNKLYVTPPCLNETQVNVYLGKQEVRDALHIPAQALPWTSCSSDVNMHYTILYQTMAPQYHKILSAKKRGLVYNGDVDMACNFLGDEWFTDSLEIDVIRERQPWFYTAQDMSRQIAGFVKEFTNLTVITIKGAGHMVPTDRPQQALEFFTKFIENKPF